MARIWRVDRRREREKSGQGPVLFTFKCWQYLYHHVIDNKYHNELRRFFIIQKFGESGLAGLDVSSFPEKGKKVSVLVYREFNHVLQEGMNTESQQCRRPFKATG